MSDKIKTGHISVELPHEVIMVYNTAKDLMVHQASGDKIEAAKTSVHLEYVLADAQRVMGY